ncbi:LytR C-terminal domain-containing protein [Arcanobacterium hippocoleae]|uniref:LytR C-terminal domain-containing protein n=1 Tax=Arcanobacterium hippocoleae TaxID=149017 RepID=UPI003340704C
MIMPAAHTGNDSPNGRSFFWHDRDRACCAAFGEYAFWAGIVPFPFNKEFATNKIPEKVAVCPLAGAKPVELSQVKARVFNASSRSGLAQEVNSKLADQGVQVGSPANWESKEPVNESVRLLTKKIPSMLLTLCAHFSLKQK